MLSLIFFGIYLVAAIVIISLTIFIMNQALQFGFMSKKTKRVGFAMTTLTIAMLVVAAIGLFMVDWSAWP